MSQPPSELPSQSSRVTINLTPSVHAELRSWACEEGRSVSNLCRQLIEASLSQRQSSD
jgi:hypothetical protein